MFGETNDETAEIACICILAICMQIPMGKMYGPLDEAAVQYCLYCLWLRE